MYIYTYTHTHTYIYIYLKIGRKLYISSVEQSNKQNHNYVNKNLVATKSRSTATFPFNKLNIKFIVKNNTLKKVVQVSFKSILRNIYST